MIRITNVQVKLNDLDDHRLLGFATLEIDRSFVIKDLKIIQGERGPMIGMPNRKVKFSCPNCGTKNHLRANFCNDCGQKIEYQRNSEERESPYADVAHPTSSKCRQYVELCVLAQYRRKLAGS